MKNFSFQIPTQIIFGSGTLEQLNTISLPGKKAMIITGGTSVQKYGYLDQVYKILKYRNIDHVLYDKVVPNPIRKNVMEARDIAREKKCDFFIGLGGGSSIDTAKSVAMMMTNPGDLWDYVPVGQGGKKDFTQKGFPLIAIPTTAGTGTEGNPTSVITNEITGEKVGIRCEFPIISIVDPDLTININPRYTTYQGFDALFHNIEAFISQKANPFSDLLALEGVRLIFENLPEAVRNGMNIEARSAVSWAATLGGMVLCLASATSAHVIEHSLSGIDPTVIHGEGLIMISKAFHQLGAERIPELYSKLAFAIGMGDSKKTVQENAKAFLDALEALKIACGVGGLNLSDHGFTEDDIDRIAEGAYVIGGGALTRDQYKITDQDLKEILRNSMHD